MSAGADFSGLFEMLPIGAWRADASGRLLHANKAMARIFGQATPEALLHLANTVLPNWYAIPARRAEFWARLRADGQLSGFVSELVRTDTGGRMWISEDARRVAGRDGELLYEGTVVDVTESRRAKAALQLTLDYAGRGIVRIGADGTVLLYNRAARDLLDLPEELLARRPRIDEVVRFQEARGDFGEELGLIDPAVRALFERDRQRALMGLLDGCESYLRRARDGRVLEIATLPLPDGGVVRTYSDVTAYVQAQQELAEKTRFLQLTLDSMDQGISAIDADGRTVLSNRRHQQLLDLPEPMMAQRPLHEDVVRFQIERGDFGEDFDFVDAVARGYVRVGDKVPPIQGPESYTRQTRDGRMLEVRTRPLPDGGVVRTFTDVTAYLQAQEALAHKKAQLAALINNIPDRVWFKDVCGVYRLSNPAHTRDHGLRESQILGRTSDEVFGPEIGAQHRETDMMAMRSSGPVLMEMRVTEAGDQVRDVEIAKVAMRDDAGRVVGILGMARDITARKQAEASLIAAKEAAEAGERAKAQFLANMSHEIRTPMNAVLGLTELLLASGLSPAQSRFAQGIKTSGDALLALINNILDFSKVDSGHLELERVPLDLAECIEAALEIGGTAAAAKGLELLCQVDEGVPARVLGDPVRLRQVIVNLVSNAVKFTREGEVAVTVSLRPAIDGPPQLHVAVSDTGVGIPAERMGRLFQVFSQVDASTTRQFGGTGLGLAICRRIVTLMGGRIWVTSEVGRGSTFEFLLPCEPAPADPDAPPEQPFAGRRVLLVDDSARARIAVAAQLRRLGLQVQAVASLADACAALRTGPLPDAVLLDAPDRAAGGLADALRGACGLPELPLLLLCPTHAPQTPSLPHATSVCKPLRQQVLREALATVLAEPAPAPPAPTPAAPPLADAPLRVLLAEDNQINQMVAQHLLGRLGHAVETVGDGEHVLQAVAAARARGAPFDVVLMDVQMPVLDGLEASRRLCRDAPDVRERPWIVAMTANAMEGDREACLAAGMDHYLSKPIRAAEVAAALREASAALAARRAG